MPKYALKYAPKARICTKYAVEKNKISTKKIIYFIFKTFYES